MRLLFTLIMIAVSLAAQKRLPFRQAAIAPPPSGAPAFTLSPTADAPAESPTDRPAGSCWTNVHNVIQCAITDQITAPPGITAYVSGTDYGGPSGRAYSFVTHAGKVWQTVRNCGTSCDTPSETSNDWIGVIWAHGYTLPIPINADNTWALISLGSPDGPQYLFRLGSRSGMTRPVYGPWPIPSETGVGSQRIMWASHDPRVAFTFSKGNASLHKLWRMQCNTTCLTGSDWSWVMEKDFTSALASVWTLPIMTTYMSDPANQVQLYPYSLSDDACIISGSLRNGTKRELGFIGYNRCTDTLAVRHSDVPMPPVSIYPAGGTETVVSPPFPTGTWYNQGGPCTNSFQYCWTQYGGGPNFNAFGYRYPRPTSGIAPLSSIPPVSVTGAARDVGHGTITWNGWVFFSNVEWNNGCQVSAPCPYEDFGYALRYVPDVGAAPNPADLDRIPWKDIFHYKGRWSQIGMHMGSSTRENRSRWVFPMFYNDNVAAVPLEHLTGARNEIWAIDTTARALVAPVGSATLDHAGHTRRLTKHYTCSFNNGSCGPAGAFSVDYSSQGHPAVSFDGTLLMYQTSMSESSYRKGVQTILLEVPADITSTYP